MPSSRRVSRRSVLAFGSLTFSVLLLTACGGTDSGKSGAAGNPYGLIEPGTIKAATETGQPPFAYADASGRPVGFIIDVTDEAAKRLGLKVDYSSTTVTSSLAGLTANQYDLAASGLGVTAQRQKSVAFTKPLFWSTFAVLTTKDSTFSTFSDFSGRTVGVVTGSSQVPVVPARMPGAHSVAFPTANTAVSQLLNGNLDGFAVGGPDAEQFMAEHASLRLAASAPVDHPTAMAVPKNHQAFLDALDGQIAAMVQDGSYARLYRKYFHTAPQPQLLAVWPALARQFKDAG
ncbi:substrate-binding periplasmic protein [Streptacidiphilus sp. EB103A]|uniref:substrate-binding periplasmic protein n=1 Tax=Streptacidiphilus sp. EB103A TaxID=3156275 RepID=UPI0035159527